jgi:hypothetical protein
MKTTNKTVTKKNKNANKPSHTKINKKKPKTFTDKTIVDQSATKKAINKSHKETKQDLQYQSQINKVNNLIKEGNIRQAYSAIPDELKFPEKSKIIQGLKLDLMKKIWNL